MKLLLFAILLFSGGAFAADEQKEKPIDQCNSSDTQRLVL